MIRTNLNPTKIFGYPSGPISRTSADTDLEPLLGIHCDNKGNVYAGCGDGVNVWNPSGVLLGKIFTGRTAANFQFTGDGRMIIMGATHLYFATLGAKGAELSW